MAFDDAFAHVVVGIRGDWDKWKSGLGPRSREKKEATIFKRREELLAHWQSEMTSQERESLRPERVKSETSQNLLEARAAKELALKHLFEHVSLKRELHVAGMLLRRGLARVPVAEALAWVKTDPRFVRPNPEGIAYYSRGPGCGKQDDPHGGRGPRQIQRVGLRKRVDYSQSPCRRQ
jgi:hypothetical protein